MPASPAKPTTSHNHYAVVWSSQPPQSVDPPSFGARESSNPVQLTDKSFHSQSQTPQISAVAQHAFKIWRQQAKRSRGQGFAVQIDPPTVACTLPSPFQDVYRKRFDTLVSNWRKNCRKWDCQRPDSQYKSDPSCVAIRSQVAECRRVANILGKHPPDSDDLNTKIMDALRPFLSLDGRNPDLSETSKARCKELVRGIVGCKGYEKYLLDQRIREIQKTTRSP